MKTFTFVAAMICTFVIAIARSDRSAGRLASRDPLDDAEMPHTAEEEVSVPISEV